MVITQSHMLMTSRPTHLTVRSGPVDRSAESRARCSGVSHVCVGPTRATPGLRGAHIRPRRRETDQTEEVHEHRPGWPTRTPLGCPGRRRSPDARGACPAQGRGLKAGQRPPQSVVVEHDVDGGEVQGVVRRNDHEAVEDLVVLNHFPIPIASHPLLAGQTQAALAVLAGRPPAAFPFPSENRQSNQVLRREAVATCTEARTAVAGPEQAKLLAGPWNQSSPGGQKSARGISAEEDNSSVPASQESARQAESGRELLKRTS
jgi:hypothetical protein